MAGRMAGAQLWNALSGEAFAYVPELGWVTRGANDQAAAQSLQWLAEDKQRRDEWNRSSMG